MTIEVITYGVLSQKPVLYLRQEDSWGNKRTRYLFGYVENLEAVIVGPSRTEEFFWTVPKNWQIV